MAGASPARHSGSRPEVLIDVAKQRAADCTGSNEDQQIDAHHPAPDRISGRELHGGVGRGQEHQRRGAHGHERGGIHQLGRSGSGDHLSDREHAGGGGECPEPRTSATR